MLSSWAPSQTIFSKVIHCMLIIISHMHTYTSLRMSHIIIVENLHGHRYNNCEFQFSWLAWGSLRLPTTPIFVRTLEYKDASPKTTAYIYLFTGGFLCSCRAWSLFSFTLSLWLLLSICCGLFGRGGFGTTFPWHILLPLILASDELLHSTRVKVLTWPDSAKAGTGPRTGLEYGLWASWAGTRIGARAGNWYYCSWDQGPWLTAGTINKH